MDQPYIKIAKLTFSAAQAAIDLISGSECEEIVYNPLHSLANHHPVTDNE